MTVLLQISDPHFGTERPEVVAALERFVHELRPGVLLLSGDITQRATVAQFAAARAFVDRLSVPVVLAIPGNHDIPLFNLAARLLSPYGHFSQAFGTDLEPQFENDDVLVLTLNTTRWYRHADGEVSADQIERVARRLEAARPAQTRIVVVHQPVAVTREEDRHNLLHGHEAALRRWAAAGADMIVGGHIHLPFVLPLRERWPDLPRPLWAVQAGTAVSRRVRADAGNSVNVFRLGAAAGEPAAARRCVVERWDHSAAAQGFERVSVHDLRGADAG
ncbi:MAG: metallophosphoesterase [Burkholderiaceae bacterium]